MRRAICRTAAFGERCLIMRPGSADELREPKELRPAESFDPDGFGGVAGVATSGVDGNGFCSGSSGARAKARALSCRSLLSVYVGCTHRSRTSPRSCNHDHDLHESNERRTQ